MAETTSRFALPLLQAGQAQKELYHNEALSVLDLAVHVAVQGVGINTPAKLSNVGDCWIVGSAPTGDWSGHAGCIAGWTAGGWRFVTPTEGMLAWCMADTLWVQHIGDTWIRGRVRADSVWIGGVQVVGAQQPAIPLPAGGAVADTEARATIAAVIAALQTHGMITR